jgi:hypothetical protein
MPGNRKAKLRKRTARKTAKTLHPAREKSRPDEELGPERRVELARQDEAKRSRGKPPSI